MRMLLGTGAHVALIGITAHPVRDAHTLRGWRKSTASLLARGIDLVIEREQLSAILGAAFEIGQQSRVR